MTPEVEALAQRLEEVEKQVAHLAALVTELSDTDRTLAARSFVVRDEQGKRRAELGMMIASGETKERPSLCLFDHADVRALLTLPEEGPLLQLTHPKTKGVVNIGVDENGPGIDLFDANGKRSLFLKVVETSPQVVMFGPDGKRRLVLAVAPSGEASVTILDGNKKTRLGLGITVSGEPSVDLFDGNGQNRLTLDIISFESGLPGPGFIMRDTNGSPTVVVRGFEHGSSVCLFDPKNVDGNTSVQVVVDNKEGPSIDCTKEGKTLWFVP